MDSKKKICVCISGGGRSLSNLLAQDPSISHWNVAAVISSSTQCGGNDIARAANLPLLICDFSKSNAEKAKDQVARFVSDHKIDWIVLAGFLKMFPALTSFEGRVINIHPALLPKFGGHGMYGHHVHKAVIEAKEKKSGASVHFVNSKYDEGAVISQIKVDVTANDTPESLATRVFKAECLLLPITITALVKGDLPLPGNEIFQKEAS